MENQTRLSVRFADELPPASPFCLGTIAWGTRLTGVDLDRFYDAFRSAGGNFFDSAHVYSFWLPDGSGASEKALGEIVRRRGDRANTILATKGGHPHADGGYARPDRYLSPEVVTQDVAESLDRLGFDAIDLYYLHRDDPRVPVGEIVDMLHEHVTRGHVRALGASNWTTARMAEANAYAEKNGKTPFAASQPKYSLGVPKPSKDATVRALEPEDWTWHAATGLPVCAYSSTGNGYFATGGSKGGGWSTPTSAARLREAERLAAELGATPNQIALAYLLHQPFPVIPILGTEKLDHLHDALSTPKCVSLSAEQVHALRSGGA